MTSLPLIVACMIGQSELGDRFVFVLPATETQHLKLVPGPSVLELAKARGWHVATMDGFTAIFDLGQLSDAGMAGFQTILDGLKESKGQPALLADGTPKPGDEIFRRGLAGVLKDRHFARTSPMRIEAEVTLVVEVEVDGKRSPMALDRWRPGAGRNPSTYPEAISQPGKTKAEDFPAWLVMEDLPSLRIDVARPVKRSETAKIREEALRLFHEELARRRAVLETASRAVEHVWMPANFGDLKEKAARGLLTLEDLAKAGYPPPTTAAGAPVPMTAKVRVIEPQISLHFRWRQPGSPYGSGATLSFPFPA